MTTKFELLVANSTKNGLQPHFMNEIYDIASTELV